MQIKRTSPNQIYLLHKYLCDSYDILDSLGH